MTPFSQELKPPQNPVRFTMVLRIELAGIKPAIYRIIVVPARISARTHRIQNINLELPCG
ncbi:hypothetical protein GSY71_11975 [Pusillimonas sp. TS35]|nr:hypothetical protein [Pusillimonas sp. TS35]